MWRWLIFLLLGACTSPASRYNDGVWCIPHSEYVNLRCAMDNASHFQAAYERLQAQYSVDVVLTAYSATKAQCSKSDGVTATGKKARHGQTLAVSRDLRYMLHHRVLVVVEGQLLGVFVVEDLMPRARSRAADVYIDDVSAAVRFGVQRATLIPF